MMSRSLGLLVVLSAVAGAQQPGTPAAGRAGLSGTPGASQSGTRSAQEEELRRLRSELEVARQEVAVLKKAAAYFAREARPSTP